MWPDGSGNKKLWSLPSFKLPIPDIQKHCRLIWVEETSQVVVSFSFFSFFFFDGQVVVSDKNIGIIPFERIIVLDVILNSSSLSWHTSVILSMYEVSDWRMACCLSSSIIHVAH